ncbi:MAG: AI-2E family transporter [Archangiaceae bacterium]|nr:AI-2E family transporter [Archangiaceae bacterium]
MELAGSASWVRAVSGLAKLVAVVLLVAVLARGRAVLLPIAFATVLAFILTPAMKWLQRYISRAPAIALVMLLAVGGLGTAGYVIADQLNDLTTQVGTYTESMRQKVAALVDSSGAGPLARLEVMFARITEDLEAQPATDNVSVQLVPARVSTLERLWAVVEPLAAPLITTLFVFVLCAFMLGQRDDLRNRLIRLVGPANVTLTTRTLDEGAQRITRYLLDQTMINVAFGVVVGVGLWVVGLPYAALWGAVAALARFVPYLGPLASMLMPAALAFAIFPGWSHALVTLGLFVGLDAVTAYLIEPVVIGHRTGVSSIALLVSALFWTWLWGPLGLVLSTPITVSLAVLGRHVPALQFLAVLLGDGQVIGTEISFYQRLLARDEDEAAAIAQAHQVALGPTGVMDQIIIPTLVMAARDLGRKEIAIDDEAFIVSWSRDIFEHLLKSASRPAGGAPTRALGIAAHRTESELLLEMLAVVVAPQLGTLEVLRAATPVEDVVARVELLKPELVCIAALPPEGGPYARQLCQRLKARFPTLTVIAFRPNEPGIDPAGAAKRLREAGADRVVATLAEASAEVSRLLTAP